MLLELVSTSSNNTSLNQEPSYEDLLAANSSLLSANKLLQEENARHGFQISELKLELENLKKYIFGKKSEKLQEVDERQYSLFADPEFEKKLEEETQLEEETVPSYTRKRGRKPLPADIPRERFEYEPEDIICACCGEEKARIGEEITEELDFIPARFLIKEHVKVKRACSKCKDGVSTAKLPEGAIVIENCRAGAGLLAHVILSKYADHLPLHRQEQIFARHGIEIPRQRMCDWIGILCERYLMPISQAIKDEILKSDYIKADETKIKIQDQDKLGWLWGILGEKNDVYFEYNISRSGSVATDLFKNYQSGFIQTDLYAGYNKVYVPEGTIRVGCFAHARRKFIEVQKTAKKQCDIILQLISKLYKIEKKIKDLPIEEKLARRQKESKPIHEKLHKYLQDQSLQVLPKSKFAKAINYSLKQWDALSLFLEHGELNIDNNDIERQMRPIAVGRHNWLFAQNNRGAKWAACLFSIIATCKANKINPWDYLTDILRKIHSTKQKDIWSLTPRGWAELQ